MRILTISEVTEILGVPFYKLHYLERMKKIPKAKRTGTGMRYYNDGDVSVLREKLKEIKEGQRVKSSIWE